MTAGQTPLWLRRAVVAGLLGGLLLVGFVVMRPFLVAIAWAAIMAYVSWPLHLRVLARLGGRRTWAALVMTVMLTLALGGSLLWLGLLLRSEGVAAVREAAALLQAGVQGLMAGLGYWVAGVRAPVFWGAATAVVALIPFGAPLIWGSIGAGIGLLLWGALAVSWIDNLVRPLVISGVAKIPFRLVLFGVLGGLAAFGLIGLFVGPVILAILLALWREWDSVNADPQQAPTHPESL